MQRKGRELDHKPRQHGSKPTPHRLVHATSSERSTWCASSSSPRMQRLGITSYQAPSKNWKQTPDSVNGRGGRERTERTG